MRKAQTKIVEGDFDGAVELLEPLVEFINEVHGLALYTAGVVSIIDNAKERLPQ